MKTQRDATPILLSSSTTIILHHFVPFFTASLLMRLRLHAPGLSASAGGDSSRKAFLRTWKEVGVSGDGRVRYGASPDSGYVDVATAAMRSNQEKEQPQSDDPLREELNILEERLGISRSGSGKTKEAREKRRRKLRQELEADGFDLELQDVLDNILVSFTLSGFLYAVRAILVYL